MVRIQTWVNKIIVQTRKCHADAYAKGICTKINMSLSLWAGGHKKGTPKKNPNTQFNEKWVGKKAKIPN